MTPTECHFCQPDSLEMKASFLGETESFSIHVDLHPVTEGHILIIPKEHVTCVGAYNDELLEEFDTLLASCMDFITRTYGKAAWFEHGVLGQTIFHSHVHVLPFEGGIKEIIPEGDDMISFVEDPTELSWLYEAEGGYLAVFLRDKLHVIDASLAEPRFFRNRFAEALGTPERANWQMVKDDAAMMNTFADEVAHVREMWESDSEIL